MLGFYSSSTMTNNRPWLFLDMAGTVFASPIDWERENLAGARLLVDWLKKQGEKIGDKSKVVEKVLDEGRRLRTRAKQARIEYRLFDVLKTALSQLGHQLDNNQLKQAELTYLRPELSLTKPAEGAPEVLRRLKQEEYGLAILSNTPSEEFVWSSLKAYGLEDIFDHVIISAQVGYRKPHDKFLEYVRTQIQFMPEQTLMVGDRLYDDIGAARGLGVRGIWFAAQPHSDNKPYAGLLTPTATVDNFQELYKVIKSLI